MTAISNEGLHKYRYKGYQIENGCEIEGVVYEQSLQDAYASISRRHAALWTSWHSLAIYKNDVKLVEHVGNSKKDGKSKPHVKLANKGEAVTTPLPVPLLPSTVPKVEPIVPKRDIFTNRQLSVLHNGIKIKEA